MAAFGEVVLCSGIPTQALLSAILGLAGLGSAASLEEPSLPFVSSLILADTFLIIALMIWLMKRRGESPRLLWLGSKPVRQEAFMGILLVPLIFMTVVVLLNAIRLTAPWLHNVPDNPLESLARGGPVNAALFGVVAIVGGGVREELQRAFLLRRFEQHLGGSAVGVLVLSVGFGLGHYLQGWDAAITTGVLGAIWAIVYLRRRSSVAPLVSHAGFNSLEILRVALIGG
jgi:membrane protease YdiL (CAAX protease family)